MEALGDSSFPFLFQLLEAACLFIFIFILFIYLFKPTGPSRSFTASSTASWSLGPQPLLHGYVSSDPDPPLPPLTETHVNAESSSLLQTLHAVCCPFCMWGSTVKSSRSRSHGVHWVVNTFGGGAGVHHSCYPSKRGLLSRTEPGLTYTSSHAQPVLKQAY